MKEENETNKIEQISLFYKLITIYYNLGWRWNKAIAVEYKSHIWWQNNAIYNNYKNDIYYSWQNC